MKRLALLTILLLAATPSLVRGQCDGITWQWDADQQILAIDHHFEDNCAVFAIEYEVTLGDGVIAVEETSICYSAAWCTCPYEGHLQLADLAPEIEFENPWADTHPIRVVHLLDDQRKPGNQHNR